MRGGIFLGKREERHFGRQSQKEEIPKGKRGGGEEETEAL